MPPARARRRLQRRGILPARPIQKHARAPRAHLRLSSSRLSLPSQQVNFKWVIYNEMSPTGEPGSLSKDHMQRFIPFRAIIGIQFVGMPPDTKLVVTYKTRDGGRDQLLVAPKLEDMLDIEKLSEAVKQFMRTYMNKRKTAGVPSMADAQAALLVERGSSRSSDSDEEEE